MTNSDLKDGGYIMINGWPCKIVEMSISKTRKHGHTKVHFVDLDIFMGKNYEDISPSTHVSDVSAVQREEYQLDGIDDDDEFLLLTDMNDNTKNDAISNSLDSSDSSIVTIISALGKEACISMKDAE
ncbi:translation protein SH3-like domain-containing protein [Aspergillus tamarii]|uniref:Eukaryotic translation initiation factor 5A n=1 Tax=Aspergillus tamarii TaxID=41984 RepID=A0A5N6UFD4_ASPTM|nr:translation protein SH3-like domain-containing protein [Aspergillus tamarii]